MPFPKGYKENRFLDLAEKIVDGLISQGIRSPIMLGLDRKMLTKAISKAIVDNLTYGNLGTLTMRNNKGQITAKLYIMPDGTLADDSWLCNLGWGNPLKRELKESHIRTHPNEKLQTK